MLERMRLVMWWRCALIALGLAVLGPGQGCKSDEERAPMAPSLGNGSHTQPPPAHGGGSGNGPGEDEDAGALADAGLDGGRSVSADAGSVLGSECQDTEAAMFMGEDPSVEPIATTTAPSDFLVTRVQAAWDTDCDRPAFRIELSDGHCPIGRGHTLVFWFDASAIDRDELRVGLNQIVPEGDSDVVSIRYVRPSRLGPSGEWGTCEGASGTLLLRGDEPSTSVEFTKWVGNFSLDLTACGGGAAGRQQVVGTFNTTMRRTLADVCPDAGTP
jgi:hypothetical protein